MGSIVKTIPDYEHVARFEDPALTCMVTLAEAAYMWGKSTTAIHTAYLKKQISGRKSFTGGDIMISYHSIVKHYGQPKKDVFSCLLSK